MAKRKKYQKKTKKKINKQRSTKHTHKTKDRVTRIPQNIGGKVVLTMRFWNTFHRVLSESKDKKPNYLKAAKAK
jgi:hypothetical protein